MDFLLLGSSPFLAVGGDEKGFAGDNGQQECEKYFSQ
jgi:hypothetical protein